VIFDNGLIKLQKNNSMKKIFLFAAVISIVAFACAFQINEPWTEKQLISPAELSKIINDSTAKKPLLYAIGFSGGIKGSVETGPVKEKENLDKFKSALEKLLKDANIVVYCGCCPFKNCPNVRPAVKLLNDMKFTNAKLLNLASNLKVDWIEKGYPME